MAVQSGGYQNIPCQRPACRRILATIRDLASHLAMHDIDPRERCARPSSRHEYILTPFKTTHRSVPEARYSSFVDMGHSVDGRPRRRYAPSPAPYARSHRSRSKCIPRVHRRVIVRVLTDRLPPRQVPQIPLYTRLSLPPLSRRQ